MTDRIPLLVDRINSLEGKMDDLRNLIHEKHASTVEELAALWRNGPLTRIEARLAVLEQGLEHDTCKLDDHILHCPVRAEFEQYTKFQRRWWPKLLVGFGVLSALFLFLVIDHPEVITALKALLPW